MYPEQQSILDVWDSHNQILLLKPRQMGASTIIQALLFLHLYRCPDPIGALTIGHEQGSCIRMNQMQRQFARGLPEALRPQLDPDNSKVIGIRKPSGVSEMRSLMAGGRGQGRSFTYQVAVFSEMGLYPRGSSATEGTAVDEDVVASVQSTMHDGPYTKLVVESTGNGPTGVFYRFVQKARESRDWAFLFFRWFDFAHYVREPHPDLYPLTPEEEELQHLHGLSDAQLQWRRFKLETYSIQRFKREYPSTWEEPFLHGEGTWFDAEALNKVLAALGPVEDGGAQVVYEEAEPGCKYFIGMDTAGGTGGDYAVVCVLRHDYEQVCIWRSNTASPRKQAEVAVQLSSKYPGPDGLPALILCEANNFGATVIMHMGKLGGRLWKDIKGKDWWTQGGRAGESKVKVYTHARDLVDQGTCCSSGPDERRGLRDPRTLHELTTVREDRKGNICSPEGSNDDHADAYVFALWCARGYYVASQREAEPPGRGQLRRLRRMTS
ncbi:MAG: hypothetical protein GY788_21045 [bacterium]|nr:hypothetical protein [bacterium]